MSSKKLRRLSRKFNSALKVSSSAAEDSSEYLCLQCRQAGHVFNDCPNEWYTEDFIIAQKRKEMDFGTFDEMKDQPLCARCEELDVLTFINQDLAWDSMLGLQDKVVRESGILKSLGPVGRIIFKKSCPLCRCLFAMSPEPDSKKQKVTLFPCWTMCRLEGGISMDTPEKKKFSRSLAVVLDPTEDRRPLGEIASMGDALCLLEEDRTDLGSTLGGRIIDPQTMNLQTIKTWMSTCSRLHPVTCSPIWSDRLREINLIDVQTRQLIRHPEEQCEYIALSYVWGGVNQGSYKLGDILDKIPQTIEDAIKFTLHLGKAYLWVDSLCIDQQNEMEKFSQIRMMSAIYEGATATIIAISSDSATAGLPRMRPESTMFPQMKCCIGGRRLVGLMPTLSQLIWVSSWGNRAWTLQEALLSRRCIYLSDQQMYFECNAMQCSEALDESRSWVHQKLRDADFVKNGHSESMIGAGVLRSPFVNSTHTNDRLEQYMVLVNLYSYRSMSFQEDAINGFSGILQYLTRLEYQKGFFWGMPAEDLNWAMAFGVISAIERRDTFPSWSWAGWKGSLAGCFPRNIKRPHYFQVPLKIRKAVAGSLVMLLNLPSNDDSSIETDAGEVLAPAHPFKHLIDTESTDLDFDLSTFTTKDSSSYLFIEGLIFSFKPDFSSPRTNIKSYRETENYDMEIGNVAVLLEINSVDAIIGDPEFENGLSGLLLAREKNGGVNYYHLLVLENFGVGLVAERKTNITFQTWGDDDELWEHLDVRKRKIILK